MTERLEFSESGAGHVAGLQRSGGGVPKLPIERVMVTRDGLSGDWQTDRRYHGGPDRAVCLYSADLIEALRGEGHPIVAGDVGENVTLAGIDWALIRPGVRLQLGTELTLEVTSYTAPCRTIRHAFSDKRFSRIGQKSNPGWSRVYARVLIPGDVAIGDTVTILAR